MKNRKVFLSYLGTGWYQTAKYRYKDYKDSEPTRYIQESTLKAICSDFNENDKVFMLVTPSAYKMNWEIKERLNTRINEKIPYEGLKYRLEKIKDEGLKAEIIPVEIIDQAASEDDMWKTFSKIYDLLEENDEVVFDITHGFRTGPLLVLPLLHYARFLKNITVKGIHYGAHEALDTEGYAPIWDLTALSSLQQWTSATKDFIDFGQGEGVFKLTKETALPLLKGGGKKMTDEKKAASLLNKFAASIGTYSQQLNYVRGRDIAENTSIQNLKKQLDEVQKINFIEPLKHILGTIKTKLEPFQKEDIENVFIAAWQMYEYGKIPQALTMLQEGIVSWALNECNLPYKANYKDSNARKNTLHYRENFGSLLGWANEEEKEKKDTYTFSLEEEELVKLKTLPQLRIFSIEIEKLKRFRNSINHAGYNDDIPKITEAEKRFVESFKVIVKECSLGKCQELFRI